MVGIADRKRFGQRELEGQVAAPVVTHGIRRLELRPEAELALIPGGLSVCEGCLLYTSRCV